LVSLLPESCRPRLEHIITIIIIVIGVWNRALIIMIVPAPHSSSLPRHPWSCPRDLVASHLERRSACALSRSERVSSLVQSCNTTVITHRITHNDTSHTLRRSACALPRNDRVSSLVQSCNTTVITHQTTHNDNNDTSHTLRRSACALPRNERVSSLVEKEFIRMNFTAEPYVTRMCLTWE
jgi:hypothetical protein